VVAKRGNWKHKKKLLVQRGGFYLILLDLSTLLSLSKERNNEDTMERAKKVVLISTENLERIQHQLSVQRQNPTSFADEESKKITVPQNSDNIMNTNNITQTFGTHLT